MTIKTSKWVVSTLLLCFILLGCKKEVCDFYALDPEIRSFLFKPGSYWVYQDSASNRLDTITVTATENVSTSARRNFNLGRGCYINELYNMDSKSSLQSTTNRDFYTKTTIYRDKGKIRENAFEFYKGGSPLGSDTGLSNLYLASYQTYYVNQETYQNIKLFEIFPFPNQAVFYTTRYFHSPNNGIIRFEVDSAVGRRSVWNLVSKNVKAY